jgi:hypothetical protein
MPRQYVSSEGVILTLDPPEGLPSSASVEVLDPADGVATGYAVVIDAITSNVTAQSRAYCDEFQIDDGSMIPLRRPLLALSELDERMEVWAIGRNATTIKLARKLQFSMGITGAKFISTRCTSESITLDAGRTYRAKWSLTIDGEDITRFVSFDVVDQPFDLLVLREDLEGRYPQLSNAIASDWRKLITGVTADIFNALLAAKFQPDTLRDQTILTAPAVHLLANRIMTDRAPGGTSFDSTVIKSALDAYQSSMDEIKCASHLWIDVNDDGIRDATDPQDNMRPTFPVIA